jgi:hypothetical protein
MNEYYHCPRCNQPQPVADIARAVGKLDMRQPRLVFEGNLFEGPPPTGYASWAKWAEAVAYGETIRDMKISWWSGLPAHDCLIVEPVHDFCWMVRS